MRTPRPAPTARGRTGGCRSAAPRTRRRLRAPPAPRRRPRPRPTHGASPPTYVPPGPGARRQRSAGRRTVPARAGGGVRPRVSEGDGDPAARGVGRMTRGIVILLFDIAALVVLAVLPLYR